MADNENTNNGCLHHAGIVQTVGEHERRLNSHDEVVKQIYQKIDRISDQMVAKVEEITSRLLQRPGWAVTTIITLLTTLLGISVTIIIFLAKYHLEK